MAVPCPHRNLVAEWNTRSAPCSNGRSHGGDVEHVQAGIAQRFSEQHLGSGPDRSAPGVVVARIDEGGLDTETFERVAQQILRAAVQGARGDNVRAGAGNRGQSQVHGSLAAGGGNAGHAAFERRDAFLQHRIGRVRNARIDMARAFHVEQRSGVVGVLEGERGGEIDRGGTGAGSRVWRCAGM